MFDKVVGEILGKIDRKEIDPMNEVRSFFVFCKFEQQIGIKIGSEAEVLYKKGTNNNNMMIRNDDVNGKRNKRNNSGGGCSC